MDIVEVVFTQDYQGVHSGNEFYAATSRAHFYKYQADALMSLGVVSLVASPSPKEDDTGQQGVTPLEDIITLDELRQLAKAKGIKGWAIMKYDTLLAKVSE